MIRILALIGGWTMASRILGVIRDQLLAVFLGASFVQDAYQLACRLPNMFRRLFGEGALSAAFIPFFAKTRKEHGPEETLEICREIYTLLALFLVFACILCEIFLPTLIRCIAPGFSRASGGRFDEALALTRITMPYMVFICLSAFLAAILNAIGQFGVAAASYLLFNIFGILFLSGAAIFCHIHGVEDAQSLIAASGAWGMVTAGVMQLIWLLVTLRALKWKLSLKFGRLTKPIKEFLKKLLPGLVGAGVTQLNLTIDTIIATLLPTGAISCLYFADRINQLPLGILGATIATALLPLYSKHVTDNNKDALLTSFRNAFSYALALSIPACVGIFVLADPLVVTLFGYGKFSSADAAASTLALEGYALGLPAFILLKVVTPMFFAHHDTATPVKVGLFCVIINFTLNITLLHPCQILAPPLATTIAGYINLCCLWILLRRRDLVSLNMRVVKHVLQIAFASAAMAVVVVLLRDWIGDLYSFHSIVRLACLSACVVAGVITFASLLYLGDMFQPEGEGLLKQLLGRFLKRSKSS